MRVYLLHHEHAPGRFVAQRTTPIEVREIEIP
jgi:hypothetical protein